MKTWRTYHEEWRLPLHVMRPTIAITTSLQTRQGKRNQLKFCQHQHSWRKQRPRTPIEPRIAWPWVMIGMRLNLQLTFEVFSLNFLLKFFLSSQASTFHLSWKRNTQKNSSWDSFFFSQALLHDFFQTQHKYSMNFNL